LLLAHCRDYQRSTAALHQCVNCGSFSFYIFLAVFRKLTIKCKLAAAKVTPKNIAISSPGPLLGNDVGVGVGVVFPTFPLLLVLGVGAGVGVALLPEGLPLGTGVVPDVGVGDAPGAGEVEGEVGLAEFGALFEP
jgi:hypothetical protein